MGVVFLLLVVVLLGIFLWLTVAKKILVCFVLSFLLYSLFLLLSYIYTLVPFPASLYIYIHTHVHTIPSSSYLTQ